LLNILRLKHATDALEDSTSVLSSLAMAIEGRDCYTHGHVERVSAYSVWLGRRLGLGVESLAALKLGGIVHDIGKVCIPDAILNKSGRLDELEREIVRRHTIFGYDILKSSRTFSRVLPIVRWHHERPNGRGYPDGLGDEELPILPRIVAVADVFDALSTARPYSAARSESECRDILLKMGADGDLDCEIAAMLADNLARNDPALTDVPARFESGLLASSSVTIAKSSSQ
jgi:putative two-component system response regulator